MWKPSFATRAAARYRPQRRLLRDLLLSLLATSGSLLAATWYTGDLLREELTHEQLAELAQHTGERRGGYAQPLEQALAKARGWAEGGALDLAQPARLAERFIPVLAGLGEASGLVLAMDDGGSFYLARDGEGWQSRTLEPDGRGLWQRWAGVGQLLGERRGNESFDPRQRPWYRAAVAADGVRWTRPYLFHSLEVPGVTAALAARREGRHWVIGIDLPLERLLGVVAALPVGAGGAAFLAAADGAVLLPPAAAADDPGPRVSLAPGGFPAAPALAAAEAWLAAGRPANRALAFRHDGAWWAWLRPVAGRADGLWLGIAVPEADFSGVLRGGWSRLLLVGALVLALGLLLSLLLTRHYGRRLRTAPLLAADPVGFEDGVRRLIRYGEGPNLEFKSTLRTNLATGKPGKEIELAWLKAVTAFLNGDGGVLLIGVSDAGEPLGLAADGFENDDKCLLHFKNLVQQHIGAEYSRQIRGQLGTVQGRAVLAVTCEPARDPVFLLVGKNEEMYVRSGPSSIKLTPRQMLQYVAGR